MDAESFRVIAELARKRAQLHERYAEGDGLMRLGARRALRQLAADLDASAAELDRSPQRKR